MAVYNNSYSGIITKGLGGPACCGMITLGFSLFWCKIEVAPPTKKPGSGGWAQYPVRQIPGVPRGSPYYTPMSRSYGKEQRIVTITVNVGEKKWEKVYAVDMKTAERTINIMNMFKSLSHNTKVRIANLKAAFNENDDK